MERKSKLILGFSAITLFAVFLVTVYVRSDGGTGLVAEPTEEQQIQDGSADNLGAMPGDESQSPQFTFNGVRFHYRSQDFDYRSTETGTTTPCTLRAPTGATTTPQFFDFRVTVGTTTASGLTFATSTKPNATTTRIAQDTISTNYDVFTWQTGTSTTSGPKFDTAGPGVYYTVGLDGVAAGAGNGHRIKGNCSAVFIGKP